MADADPGVARGASPVAFSEWKDIGNAHFAANRMVEALHAYSQCATLANEGHEKAVALANRSATFLALKRPAEALNDADAAIVAEPTWVKPHFRKGKALLALGKQAEARMAFEAAQVREPANKEVKAELSRLEIPEILRPETSFSDLLDSDRKQPRPGKYSTDYSKFDMVEVEDTLKSMPMATTLKNQIQAVLTDPRGDCFRQIAKEKRAKDKTAVQESATPPLPSIPAPETNPVPERAIPRKTRPQTSIDYSRFEKLSTSDDEAEQQTDWERLARDWRKANPRAADTEWFGKLSKDETYMMIVDSFRLYIADYSSLGALDKTSYARPLDQAGRFKTFLHRAQKEKVLPPWWGTQHMMEIAGKILWDTYLRLDCEIWQHNLKEHYTKFTDMGNVLQLLREIYQRVLKLDQQQRPGGIQEEEMQALLEMLDDVGEGRDPL